MEILFITGADWRQIVSRPHLPAEVGLSSPKSAITLGDFAPAESSGRESSDPLTARFVPLRRACAVRPRSQRIATRLVSRASSQFRWITMLPPATSFLARWTTTAGSVPDQIVMSKESAWPPVRSPSVAWTRKA